MNKYTEKYTNTVIETPEDTKKRKEIESVVGMKIGATTVKLLKTDWKAFYNDPKKYKDTVVVELIKAAITENIGREYRTVDMPEYEAEKLKKYCTRKKIPCDTETRVMFGSTYISFSIFANEEERELINKYYNRIHTF